MASIGKEQGGKEGKMKWNFQGPEIAVIRNTNLRPLKEQNENRAKFVHKNVENFI